MKKRTKTITLCALFTAVICVCAQISIPMPSGVAVTLQTFGVALAAFALGTKCGLFCAAAYIALGALGVPVFSAFGGGFGAILGYSGGFLWAMPVFAALCGTVLYVNRKIYKLLCPAAALIMLHACGVLWFCRVSGNGALAGLLTVSLLYLPKDIISLAAAYFIAKRVRKII